MSFYTRVSLVAACLLASSCASSPQSLANQSFVAADDHVIPLEQLAEHEVESWKPDGSLEAYIEFALRNRPELRAEVERWRASRKSAVAAYTLPAPTLTYGYFFRSVETKVGPQNHRIGLKQNLPWPGKSSASEEVALAQAEVREQRYSDVLVRVRADVAERYWSLWAIDQTASLLAQQTEILKLLAQAARGRVETGQATVADIGQVELAISRNQDMLFSLQATRASEEVRMAQSLGMRADGVLPATPGTVVPRLPTEAEADLVAAAQQHPRIQAMLRSGEVETARANQASAERYPDLGLGVDYIVTGESDANVPDNGKDPVVGSVSMSLPIWFGDYTAREDAASARRAAIGADVEAARQMSRATVRALLSQLQESERRYRLYSETLIPQAEVVYGSVLGAYEVGRGSVAAIMLAQKDLIDLRVSAVRALRDHHQRLAALESATGRPLKMKVTP